jgi:hypothetical protein
VIISVNSGSLGVIIIRFDTEVWETGKDGTKWWGGKRRGCAKRYGAAGFCGPSVCLGLFLLL